MSTVVDQRVVEMRFDNKHFENNVQTSLSTLDKLKQKLNLTGASKGLNEINNAAKNNGMPVLGSAVEAVQLKFSALQVMGVTALANLTNSAVNAGKRMVSALTIDPVKTGFQEYETQMNSVQTILANTQSKGSTLDDVNKALDTLNTYADKTIYNFTEMTRNIGTFTAAGVDLQTSVDSIQGIANLAAVSGSSSQQASTAMYQLSQALAAGKVSLMDWNSVVNAGMGGELFQNALIRTSELLKTGAKDAIATYGSFRESLTQGEWLTTEVLTETLKQLSGAYTEADLIAQGFTKEQAAEITKLAQTASDAATKVKTFSQLWDVMKESAQSGWAQTWKLIVGDFEQAKSLLTPLADFLTGVINKMSDARNKLLEGALGKSFANISKQIKSVIDPVKKSADSVKKVVDSVKDYATVVDDIIGGKWGTGQERWDSLTKAGYDWAHAQNLVNEKLGSSVRHATDYSKATEKVAENQNGAVESTEKLTKAQLDHIEGLIKQDEKTLKSMGYTKEQIQAFKDLAEASEKTGIPLREFIRNIDEIDGRYLLINSFKNAGQGLVTVIKSIAKAWRDVFPPMTSDQLFNIIAGLHKFSTNLTVGKVAAGKLRRTFKGLFAAIDIVATVLGGPLKIGLKLLTQLLGAFDLDILDVTASVGDAIVKFRDWIDASLDFTKVFEKIAPYIQEVISNIKDWVDTVKSAESIPEAIGKTIGQGIANVVNFVKDGIDTLKDTLNNGISEAGSDWVTGFANGIWEGIKTVAAAIYEFGRATIDTLRDSIDSHSPSRATWEVGKDYILGFFEGLKEVANIVWNYITEFGSTAVTKLKEVFGDVDLGTLFAGGISVGMLVTLKKFGDAILALASPLEGLGGIFDSVSDTIEKSQRHIKNTIKNFSKVLNSVKKVLNSFAFSIKAKALKDIALAILILVGAIAVLTFLDPTKLWNAVVVIGALAGILFLLSLAMDKIGKASVSIGKDGLQAANLTTGLLAIGGALLMMAAVVKIIGNMNPEEAKQGFIGLAAMVGAMVLMLGTFAVAASMVAYFKGSISSLGGTLIKISAALLLMVGVVKLMAKLSNREIVLGTLGMIAFGTFITALIAVSAVAGPNADKVGGMLIKIAIAMGLMVGVVKLISTLSWEEMGKGAVGMLGFTGFVALLVAITKHSKEVPKLGGILMAISTSMLIMAGIVKLIAGMSWGEIAKGTIGILALTGIMILMVEMVKRVKKDAPKMAATLLAMSVSIGILAGIAILLGFVDPKHMVKGTIAVALLASVMSMMIYATRGASDCKGNLIAMTVAIGIMTAAIVALSFIEPERLKAPVAALGILMGMFALIARVAGYSKRAVKSLIVMTLAVGALAGLLILMSKLEVNNSITNAVALSTLLIAMSAALFILSKTGTTIMGALKGAIALTMMIIPLAAFALVLSKLPDVSAATNSVKLLVGLMAAMTLLLIPLTLIGYLASGAVPGVIALTSMVLPLSVFALALSKLPDISGAINSVEVLTKVMTAMTLLLIPLTLIGFLAVGALAGVIALTSMVIPLAAFAYALAYLPDVTSAIGNVTLLTSLMNAMSDILVKIALVGPLAIIGVAALTGLTALVIGIGVLATAIGYLTTEYPQLQEFLNTGIPVLEQIAYAIGAFVGNLIAGFAGAVMQTLPLLAMSLSNFMILVQPFVMLAGQIDESVLTGIKYLSGAILLLVAADLITGIATLGTMNLADLGLSLSNFMIAALPFINYAKTLTPESMEGVKYLAEAIMTLTAADLINNITSFLGGGTSLADFATQLVPFGEAIADFSATVSEANINVTAVKAAAQAGLAIAEMCKSIQGSGGLMQDLFGEKDLSTFSTQITTFGRAITSFSRTVSADGAINEGAIEAAANAGKILAAVQKSIPEDKWLDGKISIDEFGEKIKSFGSHLAGYSEKVSTLDTGAVFTSMTAASYLVNIAKNIATIDEDGIEKFKKVKTIGTTISGYSDKVSGIDTSAINSSISSAKKLVSLINSMAGIDTSGVGSFKSAISSLGKTNFDGIAESFSGSASKFASIGGDLMGYIATGMQKRSSTVTKAAQTIVNNIVKVINSKKGTFKSAGTALMNQFVSGISSRSSKVKSAIKTPLASAVTTARGYYSKFYSAGSYVVDGFAAGINANTWKAEAKAKAMANAAEKAAKEALDINSPSRVFAALGSGVVEGFVKGIDDNMSDSVMAVKDMAKLTTSGFTKSIDKIRGIIDGDMSVQPTIRPVLDLSDVESGAYAINNMFSNGMTFGASANLNAVNTMMNRRNQNGVNSDVVAAIDKLGRELGSLDRNSYTINGVTYTEGDSVTDAIRTIVRAATREGRA